MEHETRELTRTKTDLQGAPIDAVLLYGLTLDDEDPGIGVLQGARRDLALIVSLGERGTPGVEVDLAALLLVLESVGRRIDVALELLERERKREHAQANGQQGVDP